MAWWFWDSPAGKPEDAAPSRLVPADDVQAVAEWLGIQPERAWLDEQAGPLSESYWDLHTKSQLS